MIKLCAKSLGLSAGILAAFCTLILGICALGGIHLDAFVTHQAYLITLNLSPLGLILGTIEAGIWGFLMGFFVAVIYNKFAK